MLPVYGRSLPVAPAVRTPQITLYPRLTRTHTVLTVIKDAHTSSKTLEIHKVFPAAFRRLAAFLFRQNCFAPDRWKRNGANFFTPSYSEQSPAKRVCEEKGRRSEHSAVFAARWKRNGANFFTPSSSEQSPAKRVCEEKGRRREHNGVFTARWKRNGANFF